MEATRNDATVKLQTEGRIRVIDGLRPGAGMVSLERREPVAGRMAWAVVVLGADGSDLWGPIDGDFAEADAAWATTFDRFCQLADCIDADYANLDVLELGLGTPAGLRNDDAWYMQFKTFAISRRVLDSETEAVLARTSEDVADVCVFDQVVVVHTIGWVEGIPTPGLASLFEVVRSIVGALERTT